MFYMPAVIEILEALVMPHRRHQQAFPWQIKAPEEFVGRPFSQLMWAFATGKQDGELPEEDPKTPQGADEKR